MEIAAIAEARDQSERRQTRHQADQADQLAVASPLHGPLAVRGLFEIRKLGVSRHRPIEPPVTLLPQHSLDTLRIRLGQRTHQEARCLEQQHRAMIGE